MLPCFVCALKMKVLPGLYLRAVFGEELMCFCCSGFFSELRFTGSKDFKICVVIYELCIALILLVL